MPELTEIIERLSQSWGYRFQNLDLLRDVLTRKSAVEEGICEAATTISQSLQLLGEKSLKLVISTILYESCSEHVFEGPGETEREVLLKVQDEVLAGLGRNLQLEEFVLRGPSENTMNDQIYADTMRGLFGVISFEIDDFEKSFVQLKRIITSLLSEEIENIVTTALHIKEFLVAISEGSEVDIDELLSLNLAFTVNQASIQTDKPTFALMRYAAQCGHVALVRELLERGIEIDRLWHGRSAMHWALHYNQNTVFDLLLEQGADFDCKDIERWCPLHVAIYNQNIYAIRKLLERNSDINVACAKGTPMEMAINNNNENIIALLKSYQQLLNGVLSSENPEVVEAAHSDREITPYKPLNQGSAGLASIAAYANFCIFLRKFIHHPFISERLLLKEWLFKDFIQSSQISKSTNDLIAAALQDESVDFSQLFKKLSHILEEKELLSHKESFGDLLAYIKENIIRSVNLDMQMIGDIGVLTLTEALASNSSVTSLDLSHNLISSFGISLITIFLSQNSNLTQLRLIQNKFNQESIRLLGDALAVNSSLESFDLSNNKLGDEGLQILAHNLTNNSMLRELILTFNMVEAEGTQALSQALRLNRGLKRLSLAENPIGVEGMRALADLLCVNTTLEELDLKFCELDSSSIEILCSLLQESNSLRSIDVRYNKFNREEIALLEKISSEREELKIIVNDGEVFEEGFVSNGELLENFWRNVQLRARIAAENTEIFRKYYVENIFQQLANLDQQGTLEDFLMTSTTEEQLNFFHIILYFPPDTLREVLSYLASPERISAQLIGYLFCKQDLSGNTPIHHLVGGTKQHILGCFNVLDDYLNPVHIKTALNKLNNNNRTVLSSIGPFESKPFKGKHADFEIVEILLQHGADPNVEYVNDIPFFFTIMENHTKQVGKFLDLYMHHGANLQSEIMEGGTIIHQTLLCCNLSLAKALVKRGILLNEQNATGETPTMAFCHGVVGILHNMDDKEKSRFIRKVKKFFELPLDFDTPNNFGRYPLEIFINSSFAEGVELVLESMQNLTIELGLKFLKQAVKLSQYNILTILLKGVSVLEYTDIQRFVIGLDINFRESPENRPAFLDKITPQMIVDFLKVLFGCPLEEPLFIYLFNQFLEGRYNKQQIIEIFFRCVEEPKLMLASRCGNPGATFTGDIHELTKREFISILLSERDRNGDTILHIVLQSDLSNEDVGLFLLQSVNPVSLKLHFMGIPDFQDLFHAHAVCLIADVNINVFNRRKETPLLLAVRRDLPLPKLKGFIINKADIIPEVLLLAIELQNDFLLYLLEQAEELAITAPVVQRIVEQDPTIDFMSFLMKVGFSSSQESLRYTQLQTHQHSIVLLIIEKAPQQVLSAEILHLALKCNMSEEVIQKLIARDVAVNTECVETAYNRELFDIAVQLLIRRIGQEITNDLWWDTRTLSTCSTVEMVLIVEQLRESINVQNDVTGNTPLHFAILNKITSRNGLPLTNILLRYGAIPHVKNKERLTPLHFVIRNRDLDLFNLLFEKFTNNIENVVRFAVRENAPFQIVRSLLSRFEQLPNYETSPSLLGAWFLSQEYGDIEVFNLLIKSGAVFSKYDQKVRRNIKERLYSLQQYTDINLIEFILDAEIESSQKGHLFKILSFFSKEITGPILLLAITKQIPYKVLGWLFAQTDQIFIDVNHPEVKEDLLLYIIDNYDLEEASLLIKCLFENRSDNFNMIFILDRIVNLYGQESELYSCLYERLTEEERRLIRQSSIFSKESWTLFFKTAEQELNEVNISAISSIRCQRNRRKTRIGTYNFSLATSLSNLESFQAFLTEIQQTLRNQPNRLLGTALHGGLLLLFVQYYESNTEVNLYRKARNKLMHGFQRVSSEDMRTIRLEGSVFQIAEDVLGVARRRHQTLHEAFDQITHGFSLLIALLRSEHTFEQAIRIIGGLSALVQIGEALQFVNDRIEGGILALTSELGTDILHTFFETAINLRETVGHYPESLEKIEHFIRSILEEGQDILEETQAQWEGLRPVLWDALRNIRHMNGLPKHT